MKEFWNRNTINKIYAVVSVLVFLFLAVSIIGGYITPHFDWVGVGDYYKPQNVDERGKTLWDWLDLLIIPVVLAGGAFLLNKSERIIQNAIEERRRESTQELETDRLRESALQTYLDLDFGQNCIIVK